MENNLIPLFGEYKAVLLPKDAENIFFQQVNFQFDGSCEFEIVWDEEYRTVSQIYGYYDDPQLIGTLDNLTEDQAREIIKDVDICGLVYSYFSDLELLNLIIHHKGIQTENPLKKPEDFIYCLSEIEIDDRCKVQCETCKEYYLPLEKEHNSETKQILIIKCKEE